LVSASRSGLTCRGWNSEIWPNFGRDSDICQGGQECITWGDRGGASSRGGVSRMGAHMSAHHSPVGKLPRARQTPPLTWFGGLFVSLVHLTPGSAAILTTRRLPSSTFEKTTRINLRLSSAFCL
jgi:hypothetical protein